MCFKNLMNQKSVFTWISTNYFLLLPKKVWSVTLGAQLYLWRTNSHQTRHYLVTGGWWNIGGMVSGFFNTNNLCLSSTHFWLSVELSIYKGCCKYGTWKYQYYYTSWGHVFKIEVVNISGFDFTPKNEHSVRITSFFLFVSTYLLFSSHLISALLDATDCFLLASSSQAVPRMGAFQSSLSCSALSVHQGGNSV